MVLKRLKSMFGGSGHGARAHVPSAPTVETILAPEHPFCAIGDVHGRYDLLLPLYVRIREEFGTDIPVIFIGDYVDRGPQSAEVLNGLFEEYKQNPANVVCLMGNHEKMMLEFIDDPAGKGARWLINGGLETLQSFNITGITSHSDVDDAMEAADALEAAMPEGMQAWMRALPLSWSSGNMHCAHAAMAPDTPPQDQNPRALLWGHPRFLREPRTDGQTVVHGHTIMQQPVVGDTRISIDTGAYETGRLTGVYVDADTYRFLE